MDLIRSNYSTLSPYAQAEAPSAPEYPYTEILEAYRGVLEQQQQQTTETNDSNSTRQESASSSSPPSSNHTGSFQRILKHFFDDYFLEDADEETASDMAQRWVAFARSGDPNYEDSKVEWMPWRYIPKEDRMEDDDDDDDGDTDFKSFMPWEKRQEYYEDIWSDVEQEEAEEHQAMMNGRNGTSDDDSSSLWSDDNAEDDDVNKLGRAYRRRALQALNMEVVVEDELRSEMKRTKSNDHDPDNPFLKILSKLGVSSWNEESSSEGRIPLATIRQVQRIAQDMGVL